jgi:D-sedoheptulose 7-phosphate isomerase
METISKIIEESIAIKQKVLANEQIIKQTEQVVEAIVKAYRSGHKVLFCGNGGSAADAQHLAAELSGRFYYDRPPLYSEALHVNTSYLTAVANDYSYDVIYARMVEAVGNEGDILMGLSTSGNSKNVLAAMEKAHQKGMLTISLTGEGGGLMASKSDYILAIPSKDTPRIQECHIMLGHIICQLVEATLFPRKHS